MEDRSVSVSGQEWAPLTTEDIQETRVKGSAGVPGVLETGREIEVALVRSNKGSTTCDWLWRAIITVFKLLMLCGLMFVIYLMLTAQIPEPNVDEVAEKIIQAGAAQHKQLEDQLAG